MARAQYSAEVHAACLAALLAGQAVGVVAGAYNVPVATLRSWKSRALGRVGPVGTAESGGGQRTVERIGELLVAYLVESLETLRAQLKVMGDGEWLKKQSAAEIAVLHGVGVDKALRLLEGLETANASAGAVVAGVPAESGPVP